MVTFILRLCNYHIKFSYWFVVVFLSIYHLLKWYKNYIHDSNRKYVVSGNILHILITLTYHMRVTAELKSITQQYSLSQALCRLTKHSIGVFQNVIDKVGLPKILTTMVLPITRIQQAVITMFASLITADVRLNRVIQDKVGDHLNGGCCWGHLNLCDMHRDRSSLF